MSLFTLQARKFHPFFLAACLSLLGNAPLVDRLAAADVELIGVASLPGDIADRSGLTNTLAGDVPHNRLGGFSGIEYAGRNRYLLLSDRGPADGATSYFCRVHEAKLTVRLGKSPSVAIELGSTTLLRDEKGRNLLGSSRAIDLQRPQQSLRFDPEGIRLGPKNIIWLSDEYGPTISGFNLQGRRIRSLDVPERYRIAHLSNEADKEDSLNTSGRQENRGMEGLAISPDGSKLWAIMQSPLLQDAAQSQPGKRTGFNCRILEIEIASGATREFVYPLDDNSLGLNEILAVNDHEFLVIERDSKDGKQAAAKMIYQINLADATDVSQVESLPEKRLPRDIKPVAKTPLIDMLDPQFGLAGPEFPQKMEGLAFGPTLDDGRRLLIVCADNDFVASQPSWFYAFAVSADRLPEFGWKY